MTEHAAIDPSWMLALHRRVHTSMSYAFALACIARWPKCAKCLPAAPAAVPGRRRDPRYRSVRECFENGSGVDPDAGRY